MDRYPNTSVLDQAQQDHFDVADIDPKYSSTKLIQINTLTTNVNQDGHIWFNLTSDEYSSGECSQLKFRPEFSEYINEQNYYYYGSIVEEDSCGCICLDGNIMLIAEEGRKYGYFTVDGRQYEIRAVDTTYSQLCILDDDYFDGATQCPDFTNNGGSGSMHELGLPTHIPEADTRSQSQCVIRVLFLYTPKALIRQGSHAALSDLADKGIRQMNQALRDSDVNNVKVARAAIQLWEMVERPNNVAEDMHDLIYNTTLHSLRGHHLADLVCVITDGGYIVDGEDLLGASGFLIVPFTGEIIHNLGDPKYALGYMIVEASAFTSKFVFAHEAAHCIGCRHQTCNTWNNGGCDDNGTYEHAHGWGNRACWLCKWRNYTTIMHQLRPEEIYFFVKRTFKQTLRYSNPDLILHGAPTGIENERDNARWIRSPWGCYVAGYWPDPPVPLEAYIAGESLLCQPLIGTYWALANGDNHPFQYEWHLSTDGINWGNVVSTDSYLDVDSYNYPIGSKVFLRLKVTDSLGKEVFAFFDVLIGYAEGPAGCMRYSEDREAEAVIEHELSVYPNPIQDVFKMEFHVTEEIANARIRLYTPAGALLHSSDFQVSHGANVELIRMNSEYKGPLMLDVQIGSRHFNKIIIKH